MKSNLTGKNRAFAALTTIALLSAPALITSCSDDDDNTSGHITKKEDNASSVRIEANRFVHEVMSTYYYWVDEMPEVDYTKPSDTEAYFYSLLSKKDRFSYITDDAQAAMDGFDGIYTEVGWDYTLTYLSSSRDTVVAVVNHVYDNTPAKAGGMKRGDLIYKVNGTVMTGSNYSGMMDRETATYGFLRFEDGKRVDLEATLTATEVTENPVAIAKVLTNTDGRKVGYLFYTSYSNAFNADLVNAFRTFQEAGVEDLVLDLRYNRGGDEKAMCVMSSLIAPSEVVKNRKTMLYYDFNRQLQAEGYSKEDMSLHFTDTLGIDLGLKRLVAITGSGTYSASEGTIWALTPYMDVVRVGATSGGKNSMMYVMSPADFTYTGSGKRFFDSSIDNWLIMPIVAIYKNANDEAFDTSDGDGLDPHISAKDYADIFTTGLKQLGDPEETLLAAALNSLIPEGEDNAAEAEETNKSVTTEMPVLGTSRDTRPAAIIGHKAFAK